MLSYQKMRVVYATICSLKICIQVPIGGAELAVGGISSLRSHVVFLPQGEPEASCLIPLPRDEKRAL